MTVGPLPTFPCLNPACAAEFDDASEVKPGARMGGAVPTAGALSICPYCGDVAMFEENPLHLRNLTLAEWAEVNKEPAFLRAHAMTLLHLAKNPGMRKPVT